MILMGQADMIKTTGKNKVDTVFVLIIFSIFALSVLMVLMLGAGIYKNMTDITGDGLNDRTLLSYIWTKIKNSDREGSVNVGEFNGISALFFDEEISGARYRTIIYQYDGWVRELFSEIGLDFLPEDGLRVMRIDDLKFEEPGYGMIRVSTGTRSLLLTPRSESLTIDG